MTSDEPTIFIVDDDASVLKGLARLTRSAGYNVATFSAPRDFLQCQKPDVHGCLLLNMAMPDLNGFELQKALVAAGNRQPIIFITGYGTIFMSVRAMKAGAMDFLTKPVNDEELLAAIRQAIEKDRKARQDRAEVEDIRRRIGILTRREHQVFCLVITGKLNKQIAAALGTAEKTVKIHRGRMMKKMKVQSVADLTWLAYRAGIATATHPHHRMANGGG